MPWNRLYPILLSIWKRRGHYTPLLYSLSPDTRQVLSRCIAWHLVATYLVCPKTTIGYVWSYYLPWNERITIDQMCLELTSIEIVCQLNDRCVTGGVFIDTCPPSNVCCNYLRSSQSLWRKERLYLNPISHGVFGNDNSMVTLTVAATVSRQLFI